MARGTLARPFPQEKLAGEEQRRRLYRIEYIRGRPQYDRPLTDRLPLLVGVEASLGEVRRPPPMGAPKQKWTSEEEDALRAGVDKHGAGKWRTIQMDPEFRHLLAARSNIDLKVHPPPPPPPFPSSCFRIALITGQNWVPILDFVAGSSPF